MLYQLWLKIQIRSLKSIVICTTYGPPNTPLSCFDTDLILNFISISSLNSSIYILGDLNYNLLNGDSQDARELVDFYRSYNLSKLIDAPTRITESSKLLLDVILGSHVNQVQKAEVIQSSISDHDLVCALLRLKKLRPKPTFVTTRSYEEVRHLTMLFYRGRQRAVPRIITHVHSHCPAHQVFCLPKLPSWIS